MADNDLELLEHPPALSTLAPPVLNHSDFIGELDDLDISEAQKVEFLQTLWWIMGAMVRMNFRVDSLIPSFQEALTKTQNTVEGSYPSTEFNVAASDDAAEKES